jgi:hypothetical protein
VIRPVSEFPAKDGLLAEAAEDMGRWVHGELLGPRVKTRVKDRCGSALPKSG